MKKESGTAYLLWCVGIFGVCGLQRFYLGQPGLGVLYLLTFGICGIGQLIDLFTIPSLVKEYNQKPGILPGQVQPQQNIIVNVGEHISSVTTDHREPGLPAKTQQAPKSLEHKILEACEKQPASLAQLIIATGEPMSDVKRALEVLANEGLLHQQISDTGSILYQVH